MATLRFKIESDEQLENIFKAEKLLLKAGVSFDTGYLTEEKIREWSLDWSLEGAELVESG